DRPCSGDSADNGPRSALHLRHLHKPQTSSTQAGLLLFAPVSQDHPLSTDVVSLRIRAAERRLRQFSQILVTDAHGLPSFASSSPLSQPSLTKIRLLRISIDS